MPYISADDYRMVQHFIAPSSPTDEPEFLALEQELYALNKRIRALPGTGLTPEWRDLMTKHRRLRAAYIAAGGSLL